MWTGACVETRKESWYWNEVVSLTIKETREASKLQQEGWLSTKVLAVNCNDCKYIAK